MPPRATTQTRVSERTEKSSRAKPPALVSPETPAPRTTTGTPRERKARESAAGRASAALRPRPAVIESPSTVTTGVDVIAAAGLANPAAARAASSRRRLTNVVGAADAGLMPAYLGRDNAGRIRRARNRRLRPNEAEPPLELRDARLTLPSAAGPVDILRGLDLVVAIGERVAVVGPSGCGKSSLIAVSAGLERTTGGRVRLLGHDLTGMGEDARAQLRRGQVALVFQAFHLLPNMTAEENVAAPLELAGADRALETARQWLARVGLGERRRHFPRQLSGGEQQRVALARALAMRPRLLFADEPTGNLDAANAERVAALIFDLATEVGAALVLATHDQRLAGRADRVIAMADGRFASTP